MTAPDILVFDVGVVQELEGHYGEFCQILASHGVDQFWFCGEIATVVENKATMLHRLQKALGMPRASHGCLGTRLHFRVTRST